LKCRYQNRRDIKTGAAWGVPGGAWRVPADWPGGVRHVGDVSLVCCSRMEREKACPGTAPWSGGERECPKRADPARDRVPIRGALADRLVVAMKPVLGAVGVERRGRVVCGVVRSVNQSVFWEELDGRAEVVRKAV